MKDVFTEIWESIRRNKLRTSLTGFAVSWGIFMLIVLLGAGNGLRNAFSQGGDQFASNTMMYGGGWTSKAFDGLKEGRRIRIDEKDVQLTGSDAFAAHIDDVIATVSTDGTATYSNKSVSVSIEGNYPQRAKMEKIEILEGRYINDKDIAGKRKVVVVAQNTAEALLPDLTPARELLGKHIKIGNFSYLVVGISKSDRMRGNNMIAAPFSTIKTIYNKGEDIDDITFTFHGLNNEKANEDFENQLRATINLRHRAAPDDKRAIWIWNRFTQNLQMNKVGSILNVALWIIGLFTLLGGIVGVSNIMLITVKERTHEFGIRKAIGAKPWDITKLILTESISITAVFGYIGMFLGMLTCELLDKTIGQASVSIMDEKIAMLVNPTVGLDVAIEATIVLIIAGSLAGFFPARKAAKVRPIEALRAE
ncbi:MAG: ABC transporter permease [Bacteroidales bacterium]|nr:ABC transporter permease [Bacteroidales bacterium]